MIEKWKVLRFNKNIAVSNFGRLKSLKTNIIWNLKPNKRDGYVKTTLYVTKEKKGRNIKLHRLVAEYFLKKVDGKTHVNHIDFDKTNNRVDNLEWCTMKENIAHYYKHKHNHVVNDDTVLYIRQNIEQIGAKKLAAMLNLKEGYVFGVANGTHRPDVHSELIRDKRTSYPVTVKKYDMQGNFIKEYYSLKSCAKENGTRIGHIQRVLSGERKSVRGFVYVSEGYKQFNKRPIETNRKHKSVIKLTLDGEQIKVFKNKKEAAIDIGVCMSSIRDAIYGRLKTVKGFIYRYA